ncbi:MAG: dihydroorotase [Acidocella sp. 20-57-95]|nr:MAG: dihydroorotase [Acidocella sp. 20-57-95]HQT62892.1 amidohydrolase/deacetylase family metallohydrolase [Acidocella sp.]HQU05021.1 amidohydrolase/deacetylase family metallohydrolase [Acidocella sp.]
MMFDTILRGGHVIDLAARHNGLLDVGVLNGKIAAVAPSLAASQAKNIIDVSGKLVLPGMIDTHGHIYEHVTGKFGLNADMVGVQSGVTTVVDQGGPSCMTLPGFRAFIATPSKTRVLCFISAYLVGGLEGHYYPELYGPGQVNVAHTARTAKENPDIVRGIKAHAEIGGASRWGLDVIKLGKKIAVETGLPLYIHLGQLWPEKEGTHIDPDELVRELVPLMDEGDVLAHPFTRHPGGFISTETGNVHPIVWAALERGVTVDVGHGSHFSFDMAAQVMKAGIKPYTLGADMHGYNVKISHAGKDAAANPFFGVAPFNLTNAMSKLLYLGMSLPEVVATVTSNPAKMLGMTDQIGSLGIGFDADISVVELHQGAFELADNSGVKVTTNRMITPSFCLRAGEYIAATSPLIPPAMESLAA